MLEDVDGGTKLSISLTVTVELPLPQRGRSRRSARIMKTTMDRTGDKFADNLLKHLGIPKSAAPALHVT